MTLSLDDLLTARAAVAHWVAEVEPGHDDYLRRVVDRLNAEIADRVYAPHDD